MKTLMINVSINLEFSTGHFSASVTGIGSNSGHRRCSIRAADLGPADVRDIGSLLDAAGYILML